MNKHIKNQKIRDNEHVQENRKFYFLPKLVKQKEILD